MVKYLVKWGNNQAKKKSEMLVELDAPGRPSSFDLIRHPHSKIIIIISTCDLRKIIASQ